MKYVRFAILVYALFFVLFGIFLFEQRKTIWDWYFILYFLINASVLIIGTFFERGRYKAKNTHEEGWVKTNERFVDHTSGKLVEVYFHPKTGERKYKEVT